MSITYSSAAAQWQEFLFILVTCVVLGAILGGIVEQGSRPKSAARQFWPSRWTAIVITTLLATVGGILWGKAAALDRVYHIECVPGQVLLSRAGAMSPTRVGVESVSEVRKRLVTSRGARPWALRIYINDSPKFETARLTDVEVKSQADTLAACIASAHPAK